ARAARHLPPSFLPRPRPPRPAPFPYTTLFRSSPEPVRADGSPCQHGTHRDPRHLSPRSPHRAEPAPGATHRPRGDPDVPTVRPRSEEHTSELQSRFDLVCRLLPDNKKRPRGVV